MIVKGSFHAHLLSLSLSCRLFHFVPFHSFSLTLHNANMKAKKKRFSMGFALFGTFAHLLLRNVSVSCWSKAHTHTSKIKIIVDNTLLKMKHLADKWREKCFWNKSERTITGFRNENKHTPRERQKKWNEPAEKKHRIMNYTSRQRDKETAHTQNNIPNSLCMALEPSYGVNEIRNGIISADTYTRTPCESE